MTKEDIITTAIHEAFLCGKEAGEAYQRLYNIMQKKVDDAKQGKPDFDPHVYDGIFASIPHTQVTIDPESALNPNSDEVIFNVQALPGHRIGDTPEEKISILEHQYCLLKQENVSLQEHFRKEIADRDNIIGELESANAGLKSQLANKDVIIADLRAQLEQQQPTVHVGSPLGKGEEFPCTDFSEGDQVVVSGTFFGDDVQSQHATILEARGDDAVVLFTDGQNEDEKYLVPYKFIALKTLL